MEGVGGSSGRGDCAAFALSVTASGGATSPKGGGKTREGLRGGNEGERDREEANGRNSGREGGQGDGITSYILYPLPFI